MNISIHIEWKDMCEVLQSWPKMLLATQAWWTGVFSVLAREGTAAGLVVHPNHKFHLNCSKCAKSVNCCSDTSPTWRGALFALLFVASSNARCGSLNSKTCEGHLKIRMCPSVIFDGWLSFTWKALSAQLYGESTSSCCSCLSAAGLWGKSVLWLLPMIRSSTWQYSC